jgi:probable rRNA maturation factor
MIRISVACPQETVPIDRRRMRGVVLTVLRGEAVQNAEISLAFVDSPTIQELNQRFLQHDEPTDVLGFPLADGPAGKLVGELVIGAQVSQVQAQARGHALEAELALYVIHGLLHLCGYDDKSEKGAAEMRARERRYLKELGFPDIAPKEA